MSLVRELAEYEKAPHEVRSSEQDFHAALFGADPAVFAHMALDDATGETAGFALWFLTFSTWTGTHGIYLEDLFVRPVFRGRGYGKALLAELARICVERGYRRLEWSVLDWNRPAIDFYAAMGAVPMDEWTTFRLTGDPLHRLGESAR